MNIMFLSTRSPYPLISGHSLRTYHILKGAAGNHKVNFLTFVQLEGEREAQNIDHLLGFCESVDQFKIPTDSSRVKLCMNLACNVFSSSPFVVRKYDSFEMRSKIRWYIKERKIDLVHVDLLPLTAYLSEFQGIPKILVNHNVESLRLYRWFGNEKNLFKKLYLGIQYKRLRKYETKAMNLYDACVVVSEEDKRILKNMGVKSKIFVVPNGTDTDFFKPSGIGSEKDSIIWLGHMDVHTNHDAALFFFREILPLIWEQMDHARMTFAGTSPPREIADAAMFDERVVATGFVDDIRPHVEKAAVFVVPIRIGSGTRLKILDAMGMKKAIVSTTVGCEGLNVADGENILIADKPRDFAQKVVRVLSDEGLRHKLEENARTLAMEYDWMHQCKRQEEVYQYVIKQRSGA